MTPVAIAALTGLLVVLCATLSWLGAHNRFVRQRQHVDESWHDVDVELRRRHDLVPGLVRVVEVYAAHERSLLQALDREQGLLAGQLAATAQGYPDLRVDRLFLDLQHRLVDTEDRLAAARRIHNSNVRAYNTRVASMPTNLVARAGRFAPVGLFEPGLPG